MEDNDSCKYNRKVVSFKDFGRFKLSEKKYDDNSLNIYTARLNDLREDMIHRAKLKWTNYSYIEISRLALEDPEKSYILIGVLYKDQKLKPSLLRELSKELQLKVAQPSKNYASANDKLFLEDETLRIRLVGNHVNVQEVVTGLVCAILGHEENGTLWVEDWCFPGYCPKPCISSGSLVENAKILLVSGLNLVNNTDQLSLDLLSEWITGMAGCINAQEEEAVIARVIIAGNSICDSAKIYYHKGYHETKSYDQHKIKADITAMHKLDSFLSTILHCCYVVLMPGEFDPACNYSMPQQPFHPCTLQKSARLKSLHGATNPWIGDIGGRIVAGSCGRPIADIMKIAGLCELSSLEWLERTLIWRHYAPTGPDTLPIHPFFKNDPFVMKECPDIYFAGNMDVYDTKLITTDEGQTIRLICVPKFSETKTAVLVNLQDLTTQSISFGDG
ncbi:DNA polymerase delta subunit 2 [Camponotus floridanus]|uniref:DNA polymerase delta subunit 2 n=1 Tax=Camponotus floridanus TaxID=104421 RepID=E1ZY07_CAMFO|nr:DNA polymerase delta subunit 2 [Camponotus floridanus]XP_011263027.1 DNA polymerase delta subunit 2 [Camponotus floridanus]EFN73926.1 DNA polymerase delta subunit 2 [Camponotus floridanus]